MPLIKAKAHTALLLVVMIIAMGRAQPIRAQGGGWSEPVQISPSGLNGWFGDPAVDSQGNVHVVWDAIYPPKRPGDEGCGVTLYAVRRDGRWSAANDIEVHDITAVARPALACDGADHLHLLFRRNQAVYYTQAEAQSAWSVQAWREPHRISGLLATYIPDLLIGPDGTIHAFWAEWVPVTLSEEEQFRQQRPPYLADIFYRASHDGGAHWSAAVNLSQTPNVGSGRVSVAMDAQGRLHVGWDEGWDRVSLDGEPQRVAYAHSLDGGRTWSEPLIFSPTHDTYAQMTVGTSQDGEVLLVWRELMGNRLLYVHSEDRGLTWSEPRPIPGFYARLWRTPFDAYDMATDALGRIHLVAVGDRAPTTVRSPESLYHLVWDGESWSLIEPIALYPGPANPEFPRITIEKGYHLHVVWFVRPEGIVTQGVKVWYAERMLDDVEPHPSPTWTPTPTFTPTPTPRPAPTPTITSAPPLPANGGRPPGAELYTESDELRILALSLLTVILLIAGVVGARWLRR